MPPSITAFAALAALFKNASPFVLPLNASVWWYFSQVPSYKATLDNNKEAISRLTRCAGTSFFFLSFEMANSRSLIIKFTTSVLELRAPYKSSFLSGVNVCLMIGRSPNF